MTVRPRSLRSVLTWGTLLLAGTALLAAATVVVLTSMLHRTSAAIETSTQSVRLTEEAEIDLLLHAQATTLILRRDLASSLQRKLLETEAHVGSDREQLLLDAARTRVVEYLGASEAGRSHEEVTALHADAYSAIQDLVSINLAQAEAKARHAKRLDYLGNIGGLSITLLVLGVTAVLLYWVRGPLIRPLLDLAQAMTQFGEGNHTARAQIAAPRELKDMGDCFNEMAAQIERQRERQRAFLAGVAHDLRNPVSVLLLSAEVARSDPSLTPDHPTRRVLDRNTRQLRKLERMISDFLDAALIEAGQLELDLKLHDLGDLLRSTIELFELTSAHHELTLSIPPEPVSARIDPMRIEQVATNLISNAIKYSPEGGKVEVHLERRKDELMLAVTDHGIGISPEAQAQLFEPFRRGLSHEGIPGVGLGLFVVRRIVEAHHGHIEVESSLGVGSTIRVFLPARSGEPVVPNDSGQDTEESPTGDQPD